MKNVLEQLGVETENNEIIFSEAEGTTILGLKWLSAEDKFTFQVKMPTIEGQITKRNDLDSEVVEDQNRMG